MTQFIDLIETTRQHLMTGQPDRLNVLDITIDDNDTSLNLRYINKGINEGSTIVIGLEELYVVDVSGTALPVSVTVIRGYNGSTAAAHTAGDFIYVNPQFSSFRIGQTVNQAMHNVSADGLFRMNHVTLDSDTTRLGYPVNIEAADFIGLWQVRRSVAGPSDAWPVLRPDEYYIDLHADTAIFPPNGVALFLREGVESGRDIRVSYKQRFDQLTNLTDDVTSTTGLHVEAHDIPPLDAAISLLMGREIKRSFINRQPEPRRAEEVPPGSANQSMLPILNRYRDRIQQEQKRLRRLYPGSI